MAVCTSALTGDWESHTIHRAHSDHAPNAEVCLFKGLHEEASHSGPKTNTKNASCWLIWLPVYSNSNISCFYDEGATRSAVKLIAAQVTPTVPNLSRKRLLPSLRSHSSISKKAPFYSIFSQSLYSKTNQLPLGCDKSLKNSWRRRKGCSCW